jgi:hypothetical protein
VPTTSSRRPISEFYTTAVQKRVDGYDEEKEAARAGGGDGSALCSPLSIIPPQMPSVLAKP